MTYDVGQSRKTAIMVVATFAMCSEPGQRRSAVSVVWGAGIQKKLGYNIVVFAVVATNLNFGVKYSRPKVSGGGWTSGELR